MSSTTSPWKRSTYVATLNDLLSPFDELSFFEDFWEKKALHVPRQDDHFYDLIASVSDFDTVLSYSDPRFPDLRVVNTADPNACEDLLCAGWIEGQKDARIGALYRSFERGGIIQILDVQNRWPLLGNFCRQLEATLHHRVNATAYLSPQHGQGFAAHYDKYDAFVLQIHGSRRWRVYEPLHLLPLAESNVHSGFLPPDQLGTPVYDISLDAGDLLYLPRGWGHAAEESCSTALYVTINVHVQRWKDLIVEALLELSDEDVRFRRSLRPGFADLSEDGSDEASYFEALLTALREKAQFQSSRERVAISALKRLQPIADGHFSQIGRAAEISPQTLLEKRSDAACLVVSSGERVTIYFPGNQVRGPSSIEPSLRFIERAKSPFTCDDLPGNLNEPGKLTLLRRLITSGLLRIAAKQSDPPHM